MIIKGYLMIIYGHLMII